ncbi:MAG: RibD family protein, partial [Polaromonas sp.]
EVPTPRQPHIVVVDSRLQTPLDAHLFIAGRACIIYAAARNDAKKAALEERGATVVMLPDANGKVDLAAMMKDLGIREINELHIEAGSKLNGSLIRAGLVDEFLIYLAPKLLGPGMGMASFGPLQALSDAIELQFQSTDRVGADLRVVARIAGRDQF